MKWNKSSGRWAGGHSILTGAIMTDKLYAERTKAIERLGNSIYNSIKVVGSDISMSIFMSTVLTLVVMYHWVINAPK